MHQPTNCLENFKIWRQGLELADAIQKITNRFSSSGSCDMGGRLKKMTHSIPFYIAEGFMMKNIKGGKEYFYRALNCLEELLKNITLGEQMGHIKKAHINKIKQDIFELNRNICEVLRYQ